MELVYAPQFVRMLKALPTDLQEEALEKIEQFRNPKNHLSLKVHKLHGSLKGKYSFSVNYKTRVVFSYLNPGHVPCLLAIGDHDVYSE